MNVNNSRSDSQVPESNRTWVSHTQVGNLRMQLSEFESARRFYRQALALVESLIKRSFLQYQKPEIIHMYIVSCHNLANSCRALGELPEAETSLLKAHSTAIAFMNDDQLPSSIRQEAYHAMRRAFNYLAGFYIQTQQTEALAKITMQTKTQGQRFIDNLVI
ncbi:MAG: hypothetical protein AAGE59_28805 [Cyanobacteria bacterium P01_F01_bin.86]